MFDKKEFGTLEKAVEALYSREQDICAKTTVYVSIDIFKVIHELRNKGMKDLKIAKYMELLLEDEEYEAVTWTDNYKPFECHCIIKFSDGVEVEV